MRRIDAVGEMPAFFRGMRALKDGERCFQANGGWGLRVVKQVAERFEGACGEIAHAVIQNGSVFCAGLLHGGLEGRLVT